MRIEALDALVLRGHRLPRSGEHLQREERIEKKEYGTNTGGTELGAVGNAVLVKQGVDMKVRIAASGNGGIVNEQSQNGLVLPKVLPCRSDWIHASLGIGAFQQSIENGSDSFAITSIQKYVPSGAHFRAPVHTLHNPALQQEGEAILVDPVSNRTGGVHGEETIAPHPLQLPMQIVHHSAAPVNPPHFSIVFHRNIGIADDLPRITTHRRSGNVHPHGKRRKVEYAIEEVETRG